MSIDVEDAVATYAAAWLETDETKRSTLLERCWSDDGHYTDPNSDVRGRQALTEHIGGFHAQMPGARIEITSGASHHNGNIYFRWRLVSAEGTVVVEGVDFGKLSEDGRIRQIVGFFGPPPEL